MGKILSTKELTESIVSNFIKHSTADYTRLLNNAPIFVTYYSRDSLESSYDKGFENVNQAVGKESPVIYNKIENLPIYKTDTGNFSLDVNEYGIDSNLESSAIILPDTVKPLEEDHFILSYQSKTILFKVTNVEFDNFNNKSFYKISFKLSDHTIDSIELQKNKDLVVDYDNISKVAKPVYDKNYYNLTENLDKIYETLLEVYLDKYYNDKFYLVIDKYSNKPFIDVMLNKFIEKYNLLSSRSNYRSYRHLNTELQTTYKYNNFNTIFESIEKQDISLFTRQVVHYNDVAFDHTNRFTIVWFRQLYRYSQAIHEINEPDSPLTFSSNLFTDEELELLTTTPIEDISIVELKIIRKYLDDLYKDNYFSLEEDLSNIDLNDITGDFIRIPILLYIIQYYWKLIKQYKH